MQPPEAGSEKQHGDESATHTQKHPKLAKIAEEARIFVAWWTSNRIMAVFTVVIAAIGLLQVCIYKSQLDEMRIDQRAWLGIKPVTVQPTLNSNLPSQFVINNIGKTTAKSITGEFTTRYLEASTPIDFRSQKELKATGIKWSESMPMWGAFSTGVLFPNDPIVIPFTAAEGNATNPRPIQWDAALQGRYSRGEIYIETHGRFTYRDAAGNYHWTQFCNIITSPGRGVSSEIGTACADYNNIDNNK